MMWKMLQQKNAEDYVISTGKDYSVRQFIELCSKELGFKMQWKNKGLKEIGIISKIYNKKIQKKIGSIIVRVEKRYFRPTEVNYLRGNSNKAIKKLNWKSKTPITSLIKDMLLN